MYIMGVRVNLAARTAHKLTAGREMPASGLLL